MRAYPTNSLNFLETVQVYFLEVTGKGLVLGSRDAELLQAWRAEGATVAAICQGIDDAVRARGELPRSIAGCRQWIEPRVEAARGLKVGGRDTVAADGPGSDHTATDEGVSPDDSWAKSVMKRIERAGKATDRDGFRAAYRDAYRQLRSGISERDDVAQLVLEVDRTLASAFFEALDDDEREALQAGIASTAQLDAMGERARAAFVESRRRKLLSERFGLVELFS
jgi:hypothetical protein